MHHPFCTQICPDMGSAYFIVNVLVVSCCSWLSKAPQNHSMCVLSRCRDSSFINTFGSFNQWHSLRRPYALMEFWASATVRCAGWHRDCTPTYTASFAIFQDAQAVFCSSRGRSVRCAGVFFPPRKVGGFGGRGQWGLPDSVWPSQSLSVCVCESCAILWRIDGLLKVKSGYYNFRLC